MNTKKMTAFIVGAMLIATVLVMAVSAAGMDRSKYADMPRMVYEFDAVDDTGIYINDMGSNEPTLRIYGEADAIYPTQSYTEADDFIYPNPVDAFDPGVIGKDSVTFNPAYMDDAASVDGDDYLEEDMKVFFRVFYEPEYGHVVDELMDTTPPGDSLVKPVSMPDGALVTETTYMLVEDNDLVGDCGINYNTGHSGVPITGAAGVTRFTLPVRSDATPADGDPGMDHEEVVDLLVAEDGSIVTGGTIEVGIEVDLSETDSVRFMDHQVTLVEACDTGTESKFEISYIGNRLDIQDQEKLVMVPNSGAKVYVNRYNDDPQVSTTDADHRWFIRVIGIDSDCDGCTVVIGRRLVAGETFYVDGVRYDMPAIYVADNDEFKYITLQSPLPKHPCDAGTLDDFSHVSCQYLAKLTPNTDVWVLPPFDDVHQMIDDIDLDKKYDIVNDCWYLDTDADHWYLDTEAGNIIQAEKGALEFIYVEEDIEARFDSSLAERHNIRKDGVQIWNWWNIYTKPYNYTELVLPDQETGSDTYKFEHVENCILVSDSEAADGNEYLVTTSFIAPNSEADEREELCKSSRANHSIIDRAADIAVVDDGRRDSCLGTPRMVFEYNAVDTEDLFVNDDGMGNATVRVYGEAGALYPTQSMTGEDDFIYPDPVDPFDPGVIAKDSVTFNPAYIDNSYGKNNEITVDGADGDEKVFLRAFYEPEYYHPIDAKMNNAGSGTDSVYMEHGALVVETTYMLLHDNGGSGHSGDPKSGAATDDGDDIITSFMLPTESKNLYDSVAGMDMGRVVDLNYASGMGPSDDLTDGEIEVQRTMVTLKEDKFVKFMDHKIWFRRPTATQPPYEIRLDINYIGNMRQVEDRLKPKVVNEDTRCYVDRLNNLHSSPDPDWRFYFEVTSMYMVDGVWQADFTVGRHLVAGETFYVDGVRYDMPAIYVTDDNKFKYITFQSPLPKCYENMWYTNPADPTKGDERNQADKSHVTCQWLANILESEYGFGEGGYYEDIHNVWVLPPFNVGHTMIDDIDLDKSWNCGGTQENISVEAAGNILGTVDPLKFYYIAEEEELRFDSSLAERHAYDGSDEIWNWWSIFTKPCQYTELVLPDQEVDGNEYLITTSFIAPNCEGAVRDMDNEPFCKPYDTHDIIDRAATLREGPDDPECKGDFCGDGDPEPDGDIDAFDFVEFCAAYGSSVGDPNYNSAGDFCGDGDPEPDGDIDAFDFVEFCAVYGTSC